MDFSRLTYTLINDVNFESRSALPDAPVVRAVRAGTTNKRLHALRGWIANGLHRAAWAIEPALPPLAGNNHRGTGPNRTTPTED